MKACIFVCFKMGEITACLPFGVDRSDLVEREMLMTIREVGELLEGYLSRE